MQYTHTGVYHMCRVWNCYQEMQLISKSKENIYLAFLNLDWSESNLLQLLLQEKWSNW